jgi:outer membrane protein OmpA-like peptidoglycan-associated protein
MRALRAVALLIVVAASAALADDEPTPPGGKGEVRALKGEVRATKGEVRAVKGEVRNLVYRVEDLAGKQLNIQVKETKTEIRIELAADVLFDFDKADIRPQAKEQLQKAADLIREHARKGTVTIEGHTDGKGADDYNQKLSDRRAQSVRDYFVKVEKVSGVKFSTKGYGKTKPVAPNAKPDGSDDPEGRQKNRRVEIVVRKG